MDPSRRAGVDVANPVADTRREAGPSAMEQNGRQRQCRTSGGFDSRPIRIILHHAASRRSSDGQRDVDSMLTAPKAGADPDPTIDPGVAVVMCPVPVA